MDFRVLMLQSIALLFWECKLSSDNKPESSQLVFDLINDLPPVENQAGTDEDKENLVSLRNIASLLAGGDGLVDRESLLSRVKISIKKDPELRQDIEDLLAGDEYNQGEINERVVSIRRELKQYFTTKKFKEEIKRIASQTLYNQNSFNVGKAAKDILTRLEPFSIDSDDEDDDVTMNGHGDIDDLEGMIKNFTNVQEDINPDSVLKTGWQAFNRMMGEVGGLRRGSMYLIGALPSRGKSLISTLLTLHTAMFNVPHMEDQSKKPLIVHFSFENDIPLNLKIAYRALWEDEFQEAVDVINSSPQAMAEYFTRKISQTGYHFKFYHIDPTTIGFRAILDRLRKLEAEGYEIHLCTLDYLAQLTNEGLPDESRAFWVRQLFKMIRNYCNPRKITMITPHQVAPDAANLLRAGNDNFVKAIAGNRYWADARSIDMEVDCEVVLNIEQGSDGKTYMAFGRGKDRNSAGTPEKDKFFFLPFSQFGALRPDINSKDSSVKTIRNAGSIDIPDEWKNSEDEF